MHMLTRTETYWPGSSVTEQVARRWSEHIQRERLLAVEPVWQSRPDFEGAASGL